MSWACPRCDRTFRQVNQRHACGVGSATTLLKGRPPALADLYRKLETTVGSFGEVEVVTRYADLAGAAKDLTLARLGFDSDSRASFRLPWYLSPTNCCAVGFRTCQASPHQAIARMIQ